jgi:hypothetical protein
LSVCVIRTVVCIVRGSHGAVEFQPHCYVIPTDCLWVGWQLAWRQIILRQAQSIDGDSLFHVSRFTDSVLGFYITCMAIYHVPQSEYRLGSALPPIEPPSTFDSSAVPFLFVILVPALSMQAPRLVAILPGSPLPFIPRLFPRLRSLRPETSQP